MEFKTEIVRNRDSFLIGTIIGLIIGRLAGIIDTILANPNPIIIFDVEMHHFWYGMIIVFLFLPLRMFSYPNSPFANKAVGFGLGVMLDDVVLIMSLEKIAYEDINSYYMGTWPSFIIFLSLFLFLFIISLQRTIKYSDPRLPYYETIFRDKKLRIKKDIVEDYESNFISKLVKNINANVHIYYVCKFCDDYKKSIRDIYGEGQCYWCKEWMKGNFNLPLWMGIKEFIRIKRMEMKMMKDEHHRK